MFDFSRIKHYYIACGYTDMRKQFDVLAALVQMYLGRGNGRGVAASTLQKTYGSHQDIILCRHGPYPAVQKPDGEAVPVAAK